MPVRDIRTRLSIEGEKELKRELAAAAREMRVLESGMKAAAAGALAADDDMGRLESASKGLRAQLAQQEKIARALAQALRDSADAFGDNSKETDEWKIKLNNALTKQEHLRKAIMDTDREMDELARDSVRAGRQLENGLGDSAEDTARSLRDMYDEMKGDISAIRGSVGFSALTDAWEFGSGIVTGLDSFAEGTRDYRRQMAFLKENIKAAGLDYNAVMDQFYEITGITGDTEGGVEGVSNLVAAGLDIEEIAEAIDMLGGAVIRFPETLKFESLADGLQETLATRQATGQYGELLERLGVNIEDFNKALAAAKTEEEAQQVMLSFLANHGLKETKEGFEATNEGLVNATTASNKLRDSLAGLGGVIDEKLAPAKEQIAEVIAGITEFLNKSDEVAGMARDDFLRETRAKTAGAIRTDEETGIVRTDFEEAFANIWKGIAGAGETLLSGDLWDAEEIKAESKTLGEEVAASVKQGMEEELQSGNWLGNTLAAGAEWIDKLFGWDDIKDDMSAEGEEASKGATDAIQEELKANTPAVESRFYAAGEAAMLQMGNGFTAGAAVALAQLQSYMMAMADMASMIAVPAQYGTGGLYGNLTAGTEAGQAVINLDGKRVGTAIFPTINTMMGGGSGVRYRTEK